MPWISAIFTPSFALCLGISVFTHIRARISQFPRYLPAFANMASLPEERGWERATRVGSCGSSQENIQPAKGLNLSTARSVLLKGRTLRRERQEKNTHLSSPLNDATEVVRTAHRVSTWEHGRGRLPSEMSLMGSSWEHRVVAVLWGHNRGDEHEKLNANGQFLLQLFQNQAILRFRCQIICEFLLCIGHYPGGFHGVLFQSERPSRRINYCHTLGIQSQKLQTQVMLMF